MVDVRFSILGPLTVVGSNGAALHSAGKNHRAILGYLLIHSSSVVAMSKLLDKIWSGAPPRTARKMVHNAISEIRRSFGSDNNEPDFIITQSPGYRLCVDPESVDLYAFRRLVREANELVVSGDLPSASARFRAGLDLWDGDALSDLVEAGFRWPELGAIENERLAAYEAFFAAELRRGRHHQVATELDGVLAKWPSRERLGSQYMLALYRSGRQVEALEFYRGVRRRLNEQLGIAPGIKLERLHELILQHDPRLDIDPAVSMPVNGLPLF